jgi:hypothetical protein
VAGLAAKLSAMVVQQDLATQIRRFGSRGEDSALVQLEQ